MRKFIKFVLAAAWAVTVLVSCDKMSSSETALRDGEIRFGEAGITVDTKAFTETTATTLRGSGFNAAAIFDSDGSAMFNDAVAYSDGTYGVPGKKYYWPVSGTMSFYAVYPKSQAISVSTGGVATLSYSHNTDIDLVAAKAANVTRRSTAVMLSFDHILSQVNVKAKGAETTVDYKVFSVKLTDASGGTYTYVNGEWTPGSTTQAYSVYSSASGLSVSTSSLTNVGSTMSFIPGAVKLQVVWKCYNKSTSTVVCEKDVTVDVNLAQGKNTTLNLTLPFDSSPLTFDISVGAWTPASQDISMESPSV